MDAATLKRRAQLFVEWHDALHRKDGLEPDFARGETVRLAAEYLKTTAWHNTDALELEAAAREIWDANRAAKLQKKQEERAARKEKSKQRQFKF